MGLGEGFFRGGVGLCWGVGRGWRGVRGTSEGGYRGKKSVLGGEERVWAREREGEGEGGFYDRIVDS